MDGRDVRAFVTIAIFLTSLLLLTGLIRLARAAKADRVNQLLKDKTCSACDLEGIHLRNADLSEANLENANLKSST
ncbi:MAG TPA: pentapeptide repeat-containing protein, partial [Crinalium sp.]